MYNRLDYVGNIKMRAFLKLAQILNSLCTCLSAICRPLFTAKCEGSNDITKSELFITLPKLAQDFVIFFLMSWFRFLRIHIYPT